tara:strand:+ start:352 stop:975 length:624 start_codon:yes stop_codon:yes gene_type:complete
MIIIGLTGSVGSGKSETSKFFLRKNIPVFDCDQKISDLLKKVKVKKNIKEEIPEAFSGNVLDKTKLAKIVFREEKKLKFLEQILYKSLKKFQAKWLRQNLSLRKNLVVIDVPLLFEKDTLEKYDIIIVTSCSNFIQKVRVLKRENWNKERLHITLKKQLEDKRKREMADIVIHTDRGKRYVFCLVSNLLKQINTIKKRPIKEILKLF